MEQRDAGVVRIDVLPLTAEAFEPFGEVLSAGEREPDFTGISSLGWRASFASDSPPEVMFYRSSYSGLRFSTLERHHAVTQSFVPLGHTPSVVAVAAPTSPDAAPDPGDIRAFLLDGTAGYVLKAGTWHSPDRYPLFRSPADIVIITDRATQQELETTPRGPWSRTEAVDYTDRFGIVFEFRL
jgi:ureidoglycolate lyase